MKHKIYLIVLVLACTLLPGLALAKDKPVIGVVEFSNDTSAGWWGNGVGRDLAGMLTNELASSKAFKVIERSRLESVIEEQNLSASGRVSSKNSAKIGKLLGAQYMVVGTVTSYEEDTSDSGGGISFKGFSVGGNRSRASLSVDIRVIDTTSGEISYSRTVEGSSKGGGLRLGAYRGGFGGTLNNQKKTPAGKAIRAALIETSDYLECAMVKKNRCLKKFDDREDRRREKSRSALDLD